jgi:hypothetical protein
MCIWWSRWMVGRLSENARSRFAAALLLSVIALPVSGCGGASTGSNSACVPGDQKSCACAGGGEGVQACANDGTRYTACMACPSAGTGLAGTNGSGAAGTSAGSGSGGAGRGGAIGSGGIGGGNSDGGHADGPPGGSDSGQPDGTQQYVTIEILQALIGPTKSNGTEWDGLGGAVTSDIISGLITALGHPEIAR